MVWKLMDAKNRFSEVVERALRDGPQTVTRRGKDVAVIISASDFRKLTEPKTGLVEFFQSSPLRGVDLDLDRSSETAREVEL